MNFKCVDILNESIIEENYFDILERDLISKPNCSICHSTNGKDCRWFYINSSDPPKNYGYFCGDTTSGCGIKAQYSSTYTCSLLYSAGSTCPEDIVGCGGN